MAPHPSGPSALRPEAAARTPGLRLPAEGRSAGAARAHVRDALAAAGGADLLDEALLLTTELVTNAVVHAGTEVELWIDARPGSVRIEVGDQRPGLVRRPAPDPRGEGEGGRGLVLLEALAARWGTTHARGGKTLWFELVAADPNGTDAPAAAEAGPAAAPTPPEAPRSARTGPGLDPDTLVALPPLLEQQLGDERVAVELTHRLADALELDSAVLLAGDQDEPWRPLVNRGPALDAATVGLVERAVRLAAPGPVPLGPDLTVLALRAAGAVVGALVVGPALAQAGPGLGVARLVAARIAGLLAEERAHAGRQRERGHLALLAEASEMFAATLDSRLAVTLAAQLVVPRLASWAAVLSPGEHVARVAAVAHRDEERLDSTRAALDAPASAALTEDLLRRLADDRPLLLGADDLPHELREEPPADVLALPLTARRRLLGVLLVARPPGGRYSPDQVGVLVDLARRAALAMDNARLYEERSSVAHALQALLLPADLPRSAVVHFGARYAPAGEGNEVGGDFYDVFGTADGGWGVVVGDVCGKGAAAAAITGLARDVLRLLTRDGRSPEEAHQRLNEAILELGDRGRFLTCATATVHADRWGLRVRLSTAGHPPAVLVEASGQVGFVGRPGTLLGVVDTLVQHQDEVRLRAGDSLVFYTDGVTERRSGAAMFGDEALLATLRAAHAASADEMAGRLQAAVLDWGTDGGHDDLAILVVQAAAAPGGQLPPG